MATLRENAENVRKITLKNLDLMRRGCMDELNRSGSEYFRLKKSSPLRAASSHRRAEEAGTLLEWVEAVCSSIEGVSFPSQPEIVAPNGNGDAKVEMAPEVVHVGNEVY